MSKAQLVITAVVLQGRSKSEVARDYDVSRQWVQELCRRFQAEGRCGLPAPLTAPAQQPSGRHHRGRRPHRVAAQDPDQTRPRRRRRHHRHPSGHRPQHHQCACHLHDLANLKTPRLRHTPTAQTAPLLLETLLRRATQPMLASRRDPLAPHPRRRRGNPQHPRRPFPAGHRQPGPAHPSVAPTSPPPSPPRSRPGALRPRYSPTTAPSSPEHPDAAAAPPWNSAWATGVSTT